MELIKKFSNIFAKGPAIYVNAARVLTEYKKIKGKSRSTQTTMINDLCIANYIIVGRRGNIAGNILNIKVDDPKFKSTMMNVFIDIHKIKTNKILVEKIKNLPDVEQETVDIEIQDIIESTNAETVTNESTFVKTNKLQLIQLEDNEQFRDSDGNIFNIEVRGERTKTGIRFKAKNIEKYFGIDDLVKRMMRRDRESPYTLGDDYVIQECILRPNGEKNTSEESFLHTNSGKITCSDYTQHDIFLTLRGLLQVVFTSKSGNANKDIMLDWIVSLVYTHKFGSKEERVELAKDLTKDFSKHMLNKRISGLYYVDLGELNDLYDSMHISRDQYPPNEYGMCRIAKFGLSSNIFDRVKDHKNKTNGYGRWSNKIEHKWSVMLSPSQLSNAETHLATMLKANDFKMSYIDPIGKNHDELVLVHPNKETKIKNIYRDLLNLFPSEENRLAEALSVSEDRTQLQIYKIKFEYEQKINESNLIRKDAEHRAQILELKLAMAELKLEKNLIN